MPQITVAGQSYTSDTLAEVVFPGATATLIGKVLALDSVTGDDGDTVHGNDGLDAAMQNKTLGGQSYTSGTLTEVIFPGATATLNGTVLTLDSMKGDDGDTVHGNDGIYAAMQNVVIGDNTYTADDITTVEFIGASGVLNGNTLEVSGLKGRRVIKGITPPSLAPWPRNYNNSQSPRPDWNCDNL